MHFIKAGKTTFSRAFNAKRRDFSRSLQVIPQNHSSLLLRHSNFIQNGHFYSTKSTEKEQNLNVQDTFQNVNDDVINVQGNGITGNINLYMIFMWICLMWHMSLEIPNYHNRKFPTNNRRCSMDWHSSSTNIDRIYAHRVRITMVGSTCSKFYFLFFFLLYLFYV
jgi:hypothetical protein